MNWFFSLKPSLLLFIVFILLLAVVTRFYNLNYPNDYYFDEVYHAFTAKLIARNDPRAFEWTHGNTIESPSTYVEWLHPPLAKYFQAMGILIFGENGFGWRFASAIFGLATIITTTILSWVLFKSMKISILTSVFLSTETLMLAMSRIAMNDIFLSFFVIASILSYVHYRFNPTYFRLFLVGIFTGLSMASKWSGIFILASILLFEAINQFLIVFHQLKNKKAISLSPWYYRLTFSIFTLLIMPFLIYIMSYFLMFNQGKSFDHLTQLHNQIIRYQINLEATHPYQSTPFQWITNTRPVWLFVDYGENNERKDMFALGNSFLLLTGLIAIITSITYLIFQIQKNKSFLNILFFNTKESFDTKQVQSQKKYLSYPLLDINNNYSLFILIFSYLMLWIPWLFSPRIMFFYHYTPAIPFLLINLAFWINSCDDYFQNRFKIKQNWFLLPSTIFLIINFLVFIWLLPQIIALPIPLFWKNSLTFFGLWQ